MEMQVITDARPGSFAEVKAHVDALRLEKFPEDGGALFEQVHDFGGFLFGKKGKVHHVAQGGHHDMPVVVGEFVHDDERRPASVEDKPFLVVRTVIGRKAKDARIGFRPQDIVHAPRRPQRMSHKTASLFG